MNKKNLNNYAINIFSQNGEDGIIEEILNRLQEKIVLNKWCVEFGAWDGIYLSNTCNLIKNRKYSAVLIEGDERKCELLNKNFPEKNIIKICKFVQFDGVDTLDSILSKTTIPNDLDFLSIDIDGCDYHILDSLKKYEPKVICIEYNPTIPNEVNFVQEKNFSIKQGSSAKAIFNLASQKGYGLAAVTACNLILVRIELLKLIVEDADLNLEKLRDDEKSKVYLFSGYDGTVLSNQKELNLPWHGISLKIQDIQILPKYLRIFNSDYNLLQKIVFVISVLIWKNPKLLVQHINKRMKK